MTLEQAFVVKRRTAWARRSTWWIAALNTLLVELVIVPLLPASLGGARQLSAAALAPPLLAIGVLSLAGVLRHRASRVLDRAERGVP